MTPASRATGATSEALATLQPSALSGSVACTHAASDVGVPTTVARWATVTSAAKAAVTPRCGGRTGPSRAPGKTA